MTPVDLNEVEEVRVYTNEPPSKWALIRSVLSGVMVVGLAATGLSWMKHAPSGDAQTAQVVSSVATSTAPEGKDPFMNMGGILEAKTAVVIDTTDDKILYGRNANEQLPLASLTKMMTALVALENLPSSLVVEITAGDLAEEGESGLLASEKWRLADIIAYMLTVSSNDGARAIARTGGANILGDAADSEDAVKQFVEMMNEKARSIGLLHTYFLNPTGLDVDSGVSGAYGTASDVAKLAAYVWKYHPDVFDTTTKSMSTFTSLSGFTHDATNTHALPDAISGIAASKTGYTDLAGGNLVVIFEVAPLHPIVISVLDSSVDGRFEDVRKLASVTVEYFGQQQTSTSTPSQ